MIRAVVKNGVLQPLDPLPEEWAEGRTVELEGCIEPAEDVESWEQWYEEMQQLTAALDDPEDWKRLEEALAEQKRMAKEQTRREMGLP